MNIKNATPAIKLNTRQAWLMVFFSIVMLSFICSSCGTGASGTVNPSASTTKILVVNASPDVLPLTLFFGSTQLGSAYFRYPFPSSYYAVANGKQTLQVRNTKFATILSRTDTLAPNTNYTLYVIGFEAATTAADTLRTILTVDTDVIPKLGSGKIRFVNASPRTTGLDVTANGTSAFTGIAYSKFSPYIQVPAGIYDFKVYATGTPTSVLVDLPLVTIQDGRLYTLFTHGLTGRTDTAAIGAKVIINK